MAARGEDGAALVTRMLQGIKNYQDHPFVRAVPPPEIFWQAGTVRILHYPAQGARAGRLFIVPSLINRAHILDLLPQKSFTRFMAARGMDVFLLDWGEPVADAEMTTMDGVIAGRLLPALAAVRGAGGHAPFYTLGYCMGGTLLAGALSLMTDRPDGAIFLASPWDFHAGDGALARQIRAGTPQALQMIANGHHLPVDWIQSVFATVNEDRTIHKFASFAARETHSPAAELFVAVEDWLNDGLDLPAATARACIRDWYGDNRPAAGTWHIAGKAVDPREFAMRCLVVAPRRDRLVPSESACALAELLPAAEIWRPDCGHVGMMTGGNVENTLWADIARWLRAGA